MNSLCRSGLKGILDKIEVVGKVKIFEKVEREEIKGQMMMF